MGSDFLNLVSYNIVDCSAGSQRHWGLGVFVHGQVDARRVGLKIGLDGHTFHRIGGGVVDADVAGECFAQINASKGLGQQ